MTFKGQVYDDMHILTKESLSKAILICLFCISYCSIFSQVCKIKTNKVTQNSITSLPTINDFGGSTFIACKTGVVTMLRIKVTTESAAQPNAMLFLETGIGNGVVEGGTQTYADYVQSISIPGAGGEAVVRLTTPFPVEKGETYTWYVQKDPDAGPLVQVGGLSPGNGYEGGSSWYNNYYFRDSDNVFTINIR